MTSIPPRSAVLPQHTWNAESVFPTRQAWEAEYERLVQEVPAKAKPFQGRLTESAKTLADWLEVWSELRGRVGRVAFYARMSQRADGSDQQANAMTSQAGSLYGLARSVTSFTEPEILQIGDAKLQSWMKNEPRLQTYAHYFENLYRSKAHIRSAEVEEILGMINDPFSATDATVELLVATDMTFRPAQTSDGRSQPVGQTNMTALMGDPDREVRRTAWESYADSYLALKNTLAANLAGRIKEAIFLARVRGYGSVLEARLAPDNISADVFHNLINTYRQNLPTWHKYWALRRRILGVETLHPYDIWAPLSDSKPHIPYEQAVEWIAEGLKPLGDEYVSVLRRGCLEDRWVDRYPNQGKYGGAFSYGSQGTHPFIMMNYSDALINLSTLAHELGHSMHSYYTWQTQPHIYADYSIFVAEVASNFNQVLTRNHLFRTQTAPEFQIPLIEEAFSNFHRYFFIMPTLARFEWDVHSRMEAGKAVTADDMISLMADLFEEAYGGQMHIDRPRVGITWAQFPHLYDDYYVFQYATGISGAHALGGRVLAGEPGAAEAYVGFLKTGSALYPLDALKRAGVDLTTPAAVETTFGVLADLVDRLDKLTRK